jgi:hypothetical protein
MTDNAALTALKRRRRPRGANARPSPEQMTAERESGTPPMKRSMPFLFDPAEMPVVVETNGHVPPADFEKYYVVARHGAHEQTTPDGCRTPVTRTLWLPGQHVRRDVYLTWLKDNGIEEETPSVEEDGTGSEGERNG